MRLVRQISYEELLEIFKAENAVKDSRNPRNPDDWPRARFREANEVADGQWFEYTLDRDDLARIFVHWNTELNLPKTGVMLADTLQLPRVQEYLASTKPHNLTPNSHLWLSTAYIRHDSSEEMQPRDGVFYLLDGLHRSIVWFSQGKNEISVFIAGQPQLVPSVALDGWPRL